MRRLNYFDDNLGFYQSAWLKSTIYMCGKKKTALISIFLRGICSTSGHITI